MTDANEWDDNEWDDDVLSDAPEDEIIIELTELVEEEDDIIELTEIVTPVQTSGINNDSDAFASGLVPDSDNEFSEIDIDIETSAAPEGDDGFDFDSSDDESDGLILLEEDSDDQELEIDLETSSVPIVAGTSQETATGQMASLEQVEAALERIIEKKFADKIESILFEVMERVMEKELAEIKESLKKDLDDLENS